jgi:hypothetical protein
VDDALVERPWPDADSRSESGGVPTNLHRRMTVVGVTGGFRCIRGRCVAGGAPENLGSANPVLS